MAVKIKKAKKVKKLKLKVKCKKIKKQIPPPKEYHWYVGYFPQGYRKKLELIFEKHKDGLFKDTELWIPQEDIVSIKEGKKQIKKQPIFPGYAFFKFPAGNLVWTKIIKYTPIIQFIKEVGNSYPAALTDKEVENIGIMTNKIIDVDYSKYVNHLVEIVGGPFKGFIGQCKLYVKGRKTFKIDVELINSLTREVEIGVEYVSIKK